MTIRSLAPSDWSEVSAIYRQGIATGNATFETDVPEWAVWDQAHMGSCRLLSVDGDAVQGWAALTPVSSRCVYQGVAEVSIYVAQGARGKGVGAELMAALIPASEAAGIWTLQAGIFPENRASIALHQKFGFRIIGQRERVGKMDGRWRNVALMERRSQVVGV